MSRSAKKPKETQQTSPKALLTLIPMNNILKSKHSDANTDSQTNLLLLP